MSGKNRQGQVFVIVPCYNEETRFPAEQFRSFCASSDQFRFLLVDDGSKDKTFEVLAALHKELPEKIQVMRLVANSGKAEAVRRGFVEAFKSNPSYVAYWDADLATPLHVLPAYLDVFEQRPLVEMVIGSRVKLMGRDIQRKALRHYLGRIFATCASLVLGLRIYDTQCGAKMFRYSETLRDVFGAPFLSKWIFDVELLARYVKRKKWSPSEAEACIYELPLPVWHDIHGSKVKPGDFVKAFGELLQVYLQVIRSK